MNSSFNRSNCCNVTESDDTEAAAYTATGVAHLILVVIPSLVLGTLILLPLLSNRKLRDPLSILFICITILCMVAPSTYGVLMDLSLITDKPLLGKCGTHTGEIFWVFYAIGHYQLLASTALVSVIVYFIIRWGQRNLSGFRIVVIFLVVLFMCLLGSLALFIPSFLAPSIHVRGSLCAYSGDGIKVLTALSYPSVLCYFVLPMSVIIVFSLLSFRYVKRHTIENYNPEVIKAVLKLIAMITFSVIIFRLLAVLNVFITNSRHNPGLVQWIANYSVELSYPLFLLFIIAVHKTVKETLIKKLKVASTTFKMLLTGQPPNQVAPRGDQASAPMMTHGYLHSNPASSILPQF